MHLFEFCEVVERLQLVKNRILQ